MFGKKSEKIKVLQQDIEVLQKELKEAYNTIERLRVEKNEVEHTYRKIIKGKASEFKSLLLSNFEMLYRF